MGSGQRQKQDRVLLVLGAPHQARRGPAPRSVCSMAVLSTEWAEIKHRSCSTDEDSASVSLPHESRAESWDSGACTPTDDALDQLVAAQMCPYHMKPLLFPRGTGMESEAGSLYQMESAGRDCREMQADMGATWWEEDLLEWDRRSFERLRGKSSATAVPCSGLPPQEGAQGTARSVWETKNPPSTVLVVGAFPPCLYDANRGMCTFVLPLVCFPYHVCLCRVIRGRPWRKRMPWLRYLECLCLIAGIHYRCWHPTGSLGMVSDTEIL